MADGEGGVGGGGGGEGGGGDGGGGGAGEGGRGRLPDDAERPDGEARGDYTTGVEGGAGQHAGRSEYCECEGV